MIHSRVDPVEGWNGRFCLCLRRIVPTASVGDCPRVTSRLSHGAGNQSSRFELRRNTVDLRNYLRTLRKRWVSVVLVTFLAVAVAGVVTVRTTPTYASDITLFVSTAGTADVADAYQGGLFTEQRVTSYAELLTSERLVASVAERLDLDTPVAALRESIDAQVVPDTVLLSATVIRESPQEAQRIADTIGTVFGEMVQELETPPGSDAATVKVALVDTANLSDEPVSPQPLRNLSVAGALGLLAGIALAVARESLDSSVRTAAELAEAGVPALGSTAHEGGARAHPLTVGLNGHARQTEAYRLIRTNLQFVDVDKPPRTVVVTSSVAEEGKTSTALNLGLTLAMAGVRTLVVDADLRRSQVAEYMRVDGSAGLTTVLVGRASHRDVVHPYGDTGLAIMPAGTLPPNPTELLGSQQMSELLERLRAEYDLVLLDSPPLLPVTDAAVLSRRCDGAILVVRHGKTTREQLALSIDRLRAVEAKVLGSILSMVPMRGVDSVGGGYGYLPSKKRGSADAGAGTRPVRGGGRGARAAQKSDQSLRS
jgi:capsular exopolysaccharide synthesis family protein